jgi:DNA excision repair protein ERCC-4
MVYGQQCDEKLTADVTVGSLNSGRLYSQATAMTRFYAKPMLLIGKFTSLLLL